MITLARLNLWLGIANLAIAALLLHLGDLSFALINGSIGVYSVFRALAQECGE